MKLGTKALKSFNSLNLGRIFIAMQLYRKTLKETDKRQFDVVFSKLLKSQSLEDFRSLILDGMEMEWIIKALRRRGNFLTRENQKKSALKYFAISQFVLEAKVNFQKEYGPKIKAATAPTVTATAEAV